MKLWTNFAKYGNPTPEGFEEVQWMPVTRETMHYIDFGSDEIVAGVDPDAERKKFWSDLYDKHISQTRISISSGNMHSYSRPLLTLMSICSLVFIETFI